MTPPLVIAGHGTRSQSGANEFVRFVQRVSGRLAAQNIDVAGGFIELSRPPLKDAVHTLVTGGHQDLVVVPLVLAAAGHDKGDIPGAMRREQDRHPRLRYRYGRPLGPHPVLNTLLERRVDQALDGAPRADTAVVVVGRGSTDPDSNAEVAKVTRLLWEGRGYAMAEPSFVSLAWPGVPEALDRARRLGATRIVVAQYFLFPGVLPDRIVSQAGEYAAGHPELDVRTTGVLGDTDPLADLVIERYREAIDGDIRMNCDTCVYRIAMPGFETRVGAPQHPHDHPDDPTGHHAHAHTH